MAPELSKIEIRSRFLWYAEKFILTPYLWGGDDFSGVDCSGLIVELEKMMGWMAEGEDLTADGLYRKYQAHQKPAPYMGCYVFWLNDDRAVHVGLMLGGEFFIHAGGGGSRTTTREAAIQHNAFVKVRRFAPYARFREVAYNHSWKAADPFEMMEA